MRSSECFHQEKKNNNTTTTSEIPKGLHAHYVSCIFIFRHNRQRKIQLCLCLCVKDRGREGERMLTQKQILFMVINTDKTVK